MNLWNLLRDRYYTVKNRFVLTEEEIKAIIQSIIDGYGVVTADEIYNRLKDRYYLSKEDVDRIIQSLQMDEQRKTSLSIGVYIYSITTDPDLAGTIDGAYPQEDFDDLVNIDTFKVPDGEIWDIQKVSTRTYWKGSGAPMDVRLSISILDTDADAEVISDICDYGAYITINVAGTWIEVTETATAILNAGNYHIDTTEGENQVGTATIEQFIFRIYYKKVLST